MSLVERDAKYLFHTYKRLPLEIERGEGSYLITKDGDRYLDMFAGIAVNALGYSHPVVNAAILKQVGKYLHVSNMFYQEPQVLLAERLLQESGYSKLFFTNSGTEAMEGALKLARKWGTPQGKRTIIGLSDSFHGRTYGSLSITGREKYREGFEPFLPDTTIAKFNDVASLEKLISAETLAVVVEFVQGEGGVNLVSEEFVSALRDLRNRFGFLLIADEIQTGMGRTGKLFAFNHFDITPDVVVVAKALGGGLPLGAFLGSKNLGDVLTPGVHGTTFGGNPVACAAGLATLTQILDHGVLKNVQSVGAQMKNKFETLQSQFPRKIKEVRGLGLMLGVEMYDDATKIVDTLQEAKVLVNLTQEFVLRWVPPLTLSAKEAEIALSSFEGALQ
ncbi:MAG TPA: aspartate aminotransferase family protein [Bacteroidota bacterium]